MAISVRVFISCMNYPPDLDVIFLLYIPMLQV